MPASHLADLTWPEVAEQVDADSVLAIPLGATEQHGPHLPHSVDTDIAAALCRGLCRARAEVIAAPALPYGASGEHAGFAGTLSIGHEALLAVLVELGRSATDTVRRVLFVSGHGGNGVSVRAAVERLRSEGRDVSFFEPRWVGDPHAGRAETSMLLALGNPHVRMNLAEPGDLRPLPQILPLLRSHGIKVLSPNGVLGDPRGATAEEGKDLLDRLVLDLVAHLDAWPGTSEDQRPGGHRSSDATTDATTGAAT